MVIRDARKGRFGCEPRSTRQTELSVFDFTRMNIYYMVRIIQGFYIIITQLWDIFFEKIAYLLSCGCGIQSSNV